MMLLRKMFRDMKLNKMQFISIFILSFLGIYVFSGMRAETSGMNNNFSSYVNETNLADMWVIGSGFSTADVDEVKKVENVSNVERRLVIDGTVNDLEDVPTLRLNFAENNDISSCYTIEGDDFSTDSDGIWIDSFFSKERNLEIGDKISVTVLGKTLENEIKGIIMNPEYIYVMKDNSQLLPNYYDFGIAFMSSSEYPGGSEVPYNQLIVDTVDDADFDKIESKINTLFEDAGVVSITRKTQASYVSVDSKIVSDRAMGDIFPIVFLLISVLAIITSMTRIATRQRVQIGTLKALGLSDRKIILHYVGYCFWISLIGGVLGVILGPLSIPTLIDSSLKTFFAIPNWEPNVTVFIYIVSGVVVLLTAFVGYLACRKILREAPAKSLKPAAPKIKKLSKLEKSYMWQKFSFSAHWNFRDVKRNKIRTLMGVISIASCMMLMVSAFALLDSINDITKWGYEEIMQYESKVLLLPTGTKEQAQDINKQYSGQLIEEKSIEIIANDIKKTSKLTVAEKGDLIKYQNEDGKEIFLVDKGVALTYKTAELLGVQVGDEISWHIFGEDVWKKVKVVQICRTPINQGLIMSIETFEALDYEFNATAILSGEQVNKSDIKYEVLDVQSKEYLVDSLMSQLGFAYAIIGIMIFMAILLGVVMINNLGILTFLEKTMEIVTLKVLGFNSNKIRWILQLQNIWITVVGIIIGIPLGLTMTKAMLMALSEDVDMRLTVSIISWIVCISGTFLFSISINYFFSRKVKSVDMVDALKRVE